MKFQFPFEWQIGWRYTRASKRSSRNTFISFISTISMAGIGLGVAALIVVLSVMNGFQKEVRDRMLSVLAHIEVMAPTGSMPNWQLTAKEVLQNPDVKGAAPYVEGQAMLTRDETVRGVMLRGISPEEEPKVSDIANQIKKGALQDLKAGEFGIVLGGELARALAVKVGDKITLVAPQGTMTPAGIMPRLKQFNVVGIFESGHYEYDSGLALIHLDDAEKLFRLNAPNGLRLKVNDMQRAPEIAANLAGKLSGELYLRDWTQQNRNWFAAVQTEKTMMFIILTIIIMVAAFNLVSTLVMTVTEKQADIAILRTMGAEPRSIMKIFLVQGIAIGLMGTIAGVLFGCLIAVNVGSIVSFIEGLLHVHFLPKEIYFINEMPSDLRLHDVTIIALISFVLAVLATLYPSWRAARVKPAEALRYE